MSREPGESIEKGSRGSSAPGSGTAGGILGSSISLAPASQGLPLSTPLAVSRSPFSAKVPARPRVNHAAGPSGPHLSRRRPGSPFTHAPRSRLKFPDAQPRGRLAQLLVEGRERQPLPHRQLQISGVVGGQPFAP